MQFSHAEDYRYGFQQGSGVNAITGRRKIYDLCDLGALLASHKAEGKSVVLCHGVFDLLHVGHFRHLAEAKALGDILVVTLTEDRHVNKGPHRPAFAEALRAEALAALESVDYVAISYFPSAVEAIGILKPDVYVKGPDYRKAEDDVTGGITREEEAVAAGGGRIHYTDDLTFSSSALINRYLPTFPAEVEQYLAEFRSRFSARDVIDCLNAMRTMNVMTVGEAILDEYIYCDQMGKSAKDPVLAMRFNSRELFAGGSLAVANHLANFCKSVELVAYLGSEQPQEDFIRGRLHANVRPSFIYKADSPTIVKRRYVESYLRSKHFEVYYINDEPVSEREEAQLCNLLEARSGAADAIVVADFGHGLLTPASIGFLTRSGKFLAVNTQINAANIRYHAISAYSRADYICINEQEVRLDARSRRGALDDLVRGLAARLDCKNLLVTRGSSGVTYYAEGKSHASPSFATEVIDRTGSGDAVLAITSLAVATGAPPDVVAFIANVIGAQKVRIVGNQSAVDRVATLKFVETLLK
jgi:rfaE bifunctional protein kinase chain/domain/rfaE bifunctional protein nucleotidyltransferase chain/domain